MVSDAINHLKTGRYDSALYSMMQKGYGPIDRDQENIVKEIAGHFVHSPTKFYNTEKLTVGYITEGFDFTQAPVKRMLYLSEHHDKDGLDITFFSRLSENDGYPNYKETIEKIRENGCNVVTAPQLPSALDRSLWLFEAIRWKKINVLVTYAMTTVPHLHFLCAMKPAPILIKDCLQQPEFSDLPDVTIHHSPQTMKGDKGNCRLLPFRFPIPERQRTFTKADFGIPDTAFVFASIGRSGRFAQRMFKQAIDELMDDIPDAYYLGIGSVEKSQNRQIHIGLQTCPVDILRDVADVYLDTFPLGGGWTIAEAIYANLPVVMFEAGKEHNVSETTLPEILDIPELTIERWDIDTWKKTAERLISGTTYRNKIKEKMQGRAIILSDYKGYVQEREMLYAEKFLTKRCDRYFLSGNGSLNVSLPIYANNKPESIYIDNSADITIGKGLSLSQQVTILTHEHSHDKGVPIGKAEAECISLTIGEDVQIGARAMILPGCKKIGNGAVIGAGAIVTKDIPDYEVWAGNPARKIHDRV